MEIILFQVRTWLGCLSLAVKDRAKIVMAYSDYKSYRLKG